jgi:hypothetical protein
MFLCAAAGHRLLHEGPTTWDRTWKQIRRTQPYVFTRITTKGGEAEATCPNSPDQGVED